MKFLSLHLKGFGKFPKGLNISFSPKSVNVVYGRNESGKSTLMDAIIGIFFGFEEKSDEDRYIPWASYKDYGGLLEVEMEGSYFSVERDFTTNRVEVINKNTGEVIFQEEANPRSSGASTARYNQILEQMLGFCGADVFKATTFVNQLKIETKISTSLKQLITGSEQTDYSRVSNYFEDQFFDITRYNPWNKRKNKRTPKELEITDELIEQKEQRYEEGKRQSTGLRTLQDEIERLRKSLSAMQGEESKKEKILENLSRYFRKQDEYNSLYERANQLNKEREIIRELKKQLCALTDSLDAEFAPFKKTGKEKIDRLIYLEDELACLSAELQDVGEEFSQVSRKRIWFYNTCVGLGTAILIVVIFLKAIGWVFSIITGLVLGCIIGILFHLRFNKLKRKVDQLLYRRKSLKEEIEKREKESQEIRTEIEVFYGDENIRNLRKKFNAYEQVLKDFNGVEAALNSHPPLEEIEKKFFKMQTDLSILNNDLDLLIENAPYLHKYKDDLPALAQMQEGFRGELEELCSSRKRIEQELRDKEISYQALLRSTPIAVESLKEEINELKSKKVFLEKRRDALRVAIDVLNESVSEYQSRYLGSLGETVSTYFREITHSRYADCMFTESMEPVVSMSDKSNITTGMLSTGTVDQLYFALRLGLMRQLSKIHTLPLILDDPFVHWDSTRLKVFLEIAKNISTEHQVLLFTKNEQFKEWFDNIITI